jgi:hypothetical protein
MATGAPADVVDDVVEPPASLNDDDNKLTKTNDDT